MLNLKLLLISLFFAYRLGEAVKCTHEVTIKSRDSCWQIANDNGITVEKLLQLNTVLNCDTLAVGNKVCVSTSLPCVKKYTVVARDNCYDLREKNGRISENEFKMLNPDINCDALWVGRQLCFERSKLAPTTQSPSSTTTTPKPTTPSVVSKSDTKDCTQEVTIKSRDSCWQIANDNGITVEKLLQLNTLLNCDTLAVGNKVCVSNIPPCVKKYTVVARDNCYDIRQKNGRISENDFKMLNPDINCDALWVGQLLCFEQSKQAPTTIPPSSTTTTPEPTTPSFVARNDTRVCFEFATVKSGDTCFTIATEYGVDLNEIMETYACDLLQIGDTICVAYANICQHRHQLMADETCTSLAAAYKTTFKEIEALNRGVAPISCSRPNSVQIGRRVCVWGADEAPLQNMTCIKTISVPSDQFSCQTIATDSSITIDEFRFLNPHIDCFKAQSGANLDICVRGASTRNCSFIQPVPANATSCTNLVDYFHMSQKNLMDYNPTIKCDKINICVGEGSFDSMTCVDSVRVDIGMKTCDDASRIFLLPLEILKRFNPTLDCTKPLQYGTLICISNLGLETRTAQQIIIDQLKTAAPELVPKYNNYLLHPNDEATMLEMYAEVSKSLLKPNVNSLLKQLYTSNNQVRTILDSQHPLARSRYCEIARNSTMSNTVKDCFCGNDELLVYCQIVANQEYEINLANYRATHNNATMRSKRRAAVGCNPLIPGIGNNGFSKFDNIRDGCFGGGCTYPMGLVEIGVSASICFPVVTITEDWIKFCKADGQNCEDLKRDNEQALFLIAERGVEAKLEMCAVASNLVDKILSAGGGLCWEIIKGDYKGFVGKLTISSEIQLIVMKLSGGATMKVHRMAYPDMCNIGAFECEDYCLMKHQNWDNGRAYGFVKAAAFALFGWSGINIFDFKIKLPRRVGCQAGEEAAIVLRNDRTCKNQRDNEITRRCWSGDDNITWAPLEIDNGFSFQPSILGNTVFSCEFKDDGGDGQKIGFEVYGPKSNIGKNSFYYVARNDGMYFGTEKYKEDKLVEAWDNPCEGIKGATDTKVDEEASEPTGISKVSAASCGKRIVGYYTGWGEREITENQLRKLTHVIFAFVAMNADGTIEFGAVSKDEWRPRSGEKAERRFLDLKKKARRVNAGVKVLFAIGGWDNSQHFSSVAGDSEKRAKLVDSVTNFLDKYGIDGVDVDWEYPVTGEANEGIAADKENYVQLLKQMREKLTSLQSSKNRKTPYLITLASAAGEWNIRPGYDLKGILQYADFLNVMTYDYYGAWGSQWGRYTGTPAPLYFGNLEKFSGKLNADFTMRYYSCRSKKPSQLNMGVPFYGRYWSNVGDPIDSKQDDMWREAQAVGGKYVGGYVAWRNLEKEGWNKGATSFHDKTKTPYIMNNGARKFLGYENERSLKEKVSYATNRNLGGLMIWALDLDDDADTLLNIVSDAGLCEKGSGDTMMYECVPIDDVRWWTPENDETKKGQCGRSAPLINGYYPVCDPDDTAFSCCGEFGYCGSGKKFCDCEKCVDYRKNPMKILDEPIKP